MKQFITLSTFTYQHEYSVLKLLLEQEQIRFFFENETMIGVFPFYSHALGGIRLKVHPKDYDKALRVLNSFKASPLRIV